MKWLILIYNILDWLHDKILHPIFGDEYQTKPIVKSSKKYKRRKK